MNVDPLDFEDAFAFKRFVDDAICRDDPDQFFSVFSPKFLCGPGVMKISDSYMDRICSEGAIHIATALLEGETPLRVDINSRLNIGRYPISIAVECLHYDLVDLFLRHGARTDGVDENGYCSLKIALNLFDYHLYLYDWNIYWDLDESPKESIYKLVFILCLPQMKIFLEIVSLLACNTNNVNEVFNYYAQEGKLIQMAVLLMVSKDHVMAPSSLQNMSIKEEMDLLFDVEKKSQLLIGKREIRKWVRMCKGMMATLMSKKLLLGLFDRAGDAIERYLQSRYINFPAETVVKDVARILKEAGFFLKDDDMDLSNIGCMTPEIVAILESFGGVAQNGSFSDRELVLRPLMTKFHIGKEKRSHKLRARDLQFDPNNIINPSWSPAIHTTLRTTCFLRCGNNAFYKPLKAQTKGITSATQRHWLLFKPSNLFASCAII